MIRLHRRPALGVSPNLQPFALPVNTFQRTQLSTYLDTPRRWSSPRECNLDDYQVAEFPDFPSQLTC